MRVTANDSVKKAFKRSENIYKIINIGCFKMNRMTDNIINQQHV